MVQTTVQQEPQDRGLSEGACRLLAGLDTGFAGAVVFIVWLLFHSWLVREYWWAKLNVLAALFYGDSVFSAGPGFVTFTGLALVLLIYSVLGAIFGLLARPRHPLSNLFAGIGFVLLWQAAVDSFIWRRFHPFAPSFLPLVATLPGHLLFGIALARFSGRFRAVSMLLGDSAWTSVLFPPAAVAPAVEAATPVAAPESVAEAVAVPDGAGSCAELPSGSEEDSPDSVEEASPDTVSEGAEGAAPGAPEVNFETDKRPNASPDC